MAILESVGRGVGINLAETTSPKISNLLIRRYVVWIEFYQVAPLMNKIYNMLYINKIYYVLKEFQNF